jgi:hypothetical protein
MEESFKFKSNPNWRLFCDKGHWGTSKPNDIIRILELVKKAFQDIYKIDYLNRSLAIRYNKDYPVTSLDYSTIFLSSIDEHWEQLIYQFSHELFHLMINKEIINNLKWFEETLGELSSQYFLLKLAKDWEDKHPYHDLPICSESIKDYYENHFNNIQKIPINENEFNEFINIHLISLETNWYIREINKLCAEKLLSIFIENPILWLDVIKIRDIKEKLPFKESLKYLRDKSDIIENKESINKIIKLFNNEHEIIQD